MFLRTTYSRHQCEGTAEHIHGVTGLEGVPLHEPSTILAKAHAVDFLVSTLRQAPDRSMTLCSIGPLTNVAAALIQAPDVKRGIKEIVTILVSNTRREVKKFESKGGPVHDPCVIGYLLEPSLFSGRSVNVAVETQSDLTLGETVVDWDAVTRRAPNALWLDEVDPDGFFSLLTETVAKLP